MQHDRNSDLSGTYCNGGGFIREVERVHAGWYEVTCDDYVGSEGIDNKSLADIMYDAGWTRVDVNEPMIPAQAQGPSRRYV